jgi:hypothetical protein
MSTLSAKLDFMLKNASSRQRPFAAQRGGQRKRNLKCFSDVLEALSGGDKVSLLRGFFSSRGGRLLLEQLGLEPKDTSQRLMEAIRSLHASASSPKEKRAVLSAVSPVYSRSKLWGWGLEFSPAALTQARKGTQTGESTNSSFQSGVSDTNAQSAVPDGQTRPPAISNAKSLALRWLKEHSREAANRTVTLKRKACNDPDCGADHNSKRGYVTMDD